MAPCGALPPASCCHLSKQPRQHNQEINALHPARCTNNSQGSYSAGPACPRSHREPFLRSISSLGGPVALQKHAQAFIALSQLCTGLTCRNMAENGHLQQHCFDAELQADLSHMLQGWLPSLPVTPSTPTASAVFRQRCCEDRMTRQMIKRHILISTLHENFPESSIWHLDIPQRQPHHAPATSSLRRYRRCYQFDHASQDG